MRILFVNHTSRVSGAELSLLELIDLARRDDEVVLACPPGELMQRAQAMGVPTVALHPPQIGFASGPIALAAALFSLGRSGLRLRALVHSHRVDVVHAASSRAGLLSVWCILRGPRRVTDVRDALPTGVKGNVVRWVLRASADTIVFNSEFTSRRFGPTWPARAAVVHPAVTIEPFLDLPLPSPRPPAAAPTLGVIGQITPWKGQDDAIRILSLVRRRFPGARLRIIGSVVFSGDSVSFDNRQFRRELATLAAELNVADGVEFVGQTTDLREAFQSLDLLLVPSWEEPFGRVVAEAMAAAVPVVATSEGGPSELIHNGVDGFLAPPRDPAAWIEPVIQLLESVEYSRRIAKAARSCITTLLGDKDERSLGLRRLYDANGKTGGSAASRTLPAVARNSLAIRRQSHSDTRPPLRVAIAHDYLTQRGGAERVVLSLCRAFPEAPLYTSLYDPAGTFPEFRCRTVRTLWLDRLHPLRARHRLALPVLPLAWASTRIDADVVICSSSGWAHGLRTRGCKIVYCHSPAKWLYRPGDYLGTGAATGARIASRALGRPLRRFDRWAAASADVHVANSTFVAAQIEDVYGVAAPVVPPPAGLATTGAVEPVPGIEPGFLLTVARLLPYKNVAETIEAFRSREDSRLVVVGDGPQRAELAERAPSNVTVLGEVSDEHLRWLYANCLGLIAAAREDFGLTPLEAASFGKPVAALRWGGFLDTVAPGTGVLFDRAEPAAIAAAVRELESGSWNPDAIRRHAEAFGELTFIAEIRRIVLSTVETHREYI